jgi:hypothetical protein
LVAVSAGTASISEAGAKNIGSSIAYYFHCESEGYLPIGTTPDLLFSARDSFTEQAYAMVNKQYQKSLHEKKHYTIAGDKWIPFKINREDCESAGKVIPTMIATFEKANR